MTKQNATVSRNDSAREEFTLKVLGVGGAGCNAVEHIARQRAAQSEFADVQLAAVNTDLQSLFDLSVECVMPLGATRTWAGRRRKRTRNSCANSARAPRSS